MRLAHKAAIESPLVVADAVEAMEFPHLVLRYQVQGVPRTVINERYFLDGAVPEAQFVSAILRAVMQSPQA